MGAKSLILKTCIVFILGASSVANAGDYVFKKVMPGLKKSVSDTGTPVLADPLQTLNNHGLPDDGSAISPLAPLGKILNDPSESFSMDVVITPLDNKLYFGVFSIGIKTENGSPLSIWEWANYRHINNYWSLERCQEPRYQYTNTYLPHSYNVKTVKVTYANNKLRVIGEKESCFYDIPVDEDGPFTLAAWVSRKNGITDKSFQVEYFLD